MRIKPHVCVVFFMRALDGFCIVGCILLELSYSAVCLIYLLINN